MTGGRQLPEELIISEILSRLPAKSLMRFKSVCKSWQYIISGGDSHFISFHLQRSRHQLRVLVTPSHPNASRVVSCHFVQERSSSSCLSEFVLGMPNLEAADSICMPSHCDGLILFSSSTVFSDEADYGTLLHVCNPSTRQWVTLPTSRNTNNLSRTSAMILPNTAVALCHAQLTNKYKVVRVFYRSSDLQSRTCSLGVEVLTLGSSSLYWIPEQHDPPYPIWTRYHASTAEGVIYWLIDNRLHTSSPQAIISFNLRDGQFGVIPPPPTWSKNSLELFFVEATLGVLDGDLCCTHCSGPLRHVCIYRQGMWHFSHSQKRITTPLGKSSDGRILLYYNHSFHYYDPQKQTMELIPGSTDKWPTYPDGGQWYNYLHFVPYIESLLPICTGNSMH